MIVTAYYLLLASVWLLLLVLLKESRGLIPTRSCALCM